MEECLQVFTGLWNERVNAEPGNDLVSMLAHGEATEHAAYGVLGQHNLADCGW